MGYEFRGKLSEANRTTGERYCACEVCELTWLDDMWEVGSIKCPVCNGALKRGLTLVQAADLQRGSNGPAES